MKYQVENRRIQKILHRTDDIDDPNKKIETRKVAHLADGTNNLSPNKNQATVRVTIRKLLLVPNFHF